MRLQKCTAVMLALIMVFALIPAVHPASALTSGDWQYTISEGVATITGYNGKGTEITIPAVAGGYSVEGIGEGALRDNITVRKVTISSGITWIGRQAFDNCMSLTAVTIPKTIKTIGYGAFSDCISLGSITVPNSVEEIGEYAFYNCISLKSAKISTGVAVLPGSLFRNCTSLTDVTMAPTIINSYAFDKCEGLRHIVIPDTVVTIGEGAFQNCTSLRTATIPESVREISTGYWYSSFENCPYLIIVCTKNSQAQKYAEDSNIPYEFIGTKFTVTFKNGSKTLKTQKVDVGYGATAPAKPTKTGYTFAGWDNTFDCVTANMTVNAVWDANYYTVAFNKNGGAGSMLKQGYITGMSQKLLPNEFTRKGYIFSGWSTTKTGKVVYKNKQSVKNLTPKGNITLYAVWTKVAAPAKAVTGLKLTSPKTKQLKVTYKAVSGAAGYRIEYSTSKSFTKSVTKSVHTTKLTYTIKSLSAQKTYYVRVTAYKTDSVKNKIYSKKTAAKNLKTK